MYLSLNWVKDWLKLPKDLNAKDISLSLTMSTVEVEKIIDQAKSLENIVIGKIEEITKHPDADRLYVCQVNLGQGAEQIVCGGTNLSKGILVAVAKPGAKIKWHGQGELVTLEKTKIRGVESNGMISSAEEIGLGELFPQKSVTEILDLSELKPKIGQTLATALNFNDIIIDIDNKSINHRPDLWGQYGLARELSAIYKLKLANYKIPEIKIKHELKLKVSVEDKAKCFRYLGLAIKNVKVGNSPFWLQKRLNAVGLRPINNIVDVTNYVMYELGQPMHAFDAKEIADHHIIIKTANKGEKFVTLDGQSRKLPEGALMIADKSKYIALAGIMGGQNSEISNDSSDIILESANFKASSIRRTSMALGLRSESSARFEKSLDPVLAELAIKRAAELILSICPDAYLASDLVDVNNNPFASIVLEVPEELINKRFGLIIPTAEIKSILKRLEFEVEYKAKKFIIRVPSFRATKDISIAEDIVEEVARIYGYDNIDDKLPLVVLDKPTINISTHGARDVVKWLAMAQNYNQIFTYPFTDHACSKKIGLDLSEHIKVKNALSPEQAYLNISLLPNLFAKAQENLRWFDNFKIFELERVFDKKSKGVYHTDNSKKKFLPKQDKYLTGLEVSSKKSEDLFFSVKGLVESLLEHLNIE
ncbi:MAG: phenylalanine--tRNA ligase subunit beta, partial [bacterium]|nr:phenylalanine--tRNA ligase subunit beta [bacterium]